MAFGKDGCLCKAKGERVRTGDLKSKAQNLNSFWDKVLRIDMDFGNPYGMPKNNPFVKWSHVKKEIWAYGLRNPWKFSFVSNNGDVWVDDVGENKDEEINKDF